MTRKKKTKQNSQWQQQNRPKNLHEKQALGRERLAASSLNGGLLGSRSVLSSSPHTDYRLLKMTSSQHGQLLMNWRV